MEQMNIVIVGHVDHGKSTIIGRMLADTGSLPEGKLEATKEYCKRNSRPFEYAFLLDALKDEQSQGITIDTARCFFKSKKRNYIIIDAPGHVEFLKNMVSGAARAEAAVLVIDAKEGIRENSKRHGYLLSMLGVKQIVVCVNKMDLVDYSQGVFEKIKNEYTKFMKDIGVVPKEVIPVSGTNGDNIAAPSKNLPWFSGHTMLSALDAFEKERGPEEKDFRMPVQDVYKFTKSGDDRRIVAGRVETGSIKQGDEVVFLPSNKVSSIKTIEEFNTPKGNSVSAGKSIGFTLEEQVYIRRGDVMCKKSERLPHVASRITANIFWMSRKPMEFGKQYKLKIMTNKVPVKLIQIIRSLDTDNLSYSPKKKVERHDVAECVLKCSSPIAFDLSSESQQTGRFVIVDEYDIAGGGIITGYEKDSLSEIRKKVTIREERWEQGDVKLEERATRYSQTPSFIFITGHTGEDKKGIAKKLERTLFERGNLAYFLGIGNLLRGLDADIDKAEREEHIRRFGEVSNILMRAGFIVVGTASDITPAELDLLSAIMGEESMVTITVGKDGFEENNVDLVLESGTEPKKAAAKIFKLLESNGIINGNNGTHQMA
jgi:bifunctional enzyme CysN/CysC